MFLLLHKTTIAILDFDFSADWQNEFVFMISIVHEEDHKFSLNDSSFELCYFFDVVLPLLITKVFLIGLNNCGFSL